VTNKPICETDAHGNKRWYLNGEYHRTDGPAIEWIDGSKYWVLNGVRHRTDGPAVEYANGTKYWWLNNELVEMEDVITDPKEQFWWRIKS